MKVERQVCWSMAAVDLDFVCFYQQQKCAFLSPCHFVLFILLLLSQLCLWVSPFWWYFLCTWQFNPTIEVVTFHLCGWYMLGVYLVLAFTCLGHECQDFFSLCKEMHVCIDQDLSLFSHLKVLGNGARTHVSSKGKIPCTRGPGKGRTRAAACRKTASPALR